MDRTKILLVTYSGRIVGKMALYRDNLAAFEYDKEWLNSGFSISPFSLPLEQKVFIPKIDPFEGLFGVFADSLPDGWGRLLVDCLLLKNRVNPLEIKSMERLVIVGASGMGELIYQQDYHFKNFTYLFDDTEEIWRLSPAYDLTYSDSIGGEHATCVNGNGKNPSMKDIMEVAKNMGIREKKQKLNPARKADRSTI